MHVPAGQNAAPLLRQAIAACDGLKPAEWQALKIDAGQPADPSAAEAKRILAKAAPALAALHQAAKLPRCDFGHNPDNGPLELYRELAPLKKLARLAGYSAYSHAAQGRADLAVTDLADGAAIGRFLTDDANWITVLVAGASDSINLTWADRCMGIAKSEQDLDRYLALIESRRLTFDMGRVIKAAAYSRIVTARNLHRFDREGVPTSPLMADNSPTDPGDRRVLASVLHAWTPLIGKINKASGDPQAVERAIRASDGDDMDAAFHGNNMEMVFDDPTYGGLYEVERGEQARVRCAIGMAKALIFRAKSGELPSSLDQFAPGLIDPFTDKPLRYLRTLDGFRIYSLGKDQVDDHGATSGERKVDDSPGATYDLAAVYRSPQARPTG